MQQKNSFRIFTNHLALEFLFFLIHFNLFCNYIAVSFTSVVQLRLVDSTSGSDKDGRVELGIGGVWGGVCSRGWDLQDAAVVCRMLGLPPASVAEGEAAFGNSGNKPWLGNLECIGNESIITECSHMGWGNTNRFFCERKSDAGVICGPPSSESSQFRSN